MSAQWGDYLNRLLSPQKPLAAVEEADQRAIIEKRVRNITTENWRSVINNAAVTEGEDATDVAEEWLFYFTTSNVNGTRNATFWDGVFDVCILRPFPSFVIMLFCFLPQHSPCCRSVGMGKANDALQESAILFATSKNLAGPAPRINLGKVDCAGPESTELCNSFFLSSQEKLPVFYHIASYANGSVELREVPWAAANITEGGEPAYLVKFHEEGLWKGANAWTGVFNPITGVLKEATPYVGIALGYYDKVPSWVVMVTISFLGRNIMYVDSFLWLDDFRDFVMLTIGYRSRITRQNLTPRVPPPASPALAS